VNAAKAAEAEAVRQAKAEGVVSVGRLHAHPAVSEARKKLDDDLGRLHAREEACAAAKPRQGVYRLGAVTRILTRGSLIVATLLSFTLCLLAFTVIAGATTYRFACLELRAGSSGTGTLVGGIVFGLPVAMFHTLIIYVAYYGT
jgi:hypothetical protein